MNNISKKSIKINGNDVKSDKPNKVKQNDNKSKTCDNKIICIDLISSDGSVISDPKSDTEVDEQIDTDSTVVEESIEAEEEEEEEPKSEEPKKKCKLSATFCGSVIGDKKPLYSIQFNTYLPDGHNYFATAGSNRVTIYECPNNGSIRLVDCFADCNEMPSEDKKKRKSEDYYTCCWSFDDQTGNPLVIAGGLRGIIRVIDCALKKFRHLCGHGGAINDLKVSPFDHNLLLSSSEDHSLRLWNLKTNVCVLKFGGESGHRDQVICADFYLLSDKYIVSTGMDHSIKIWSLNKEYVRNAIKKSYEYEDNGCESFKVLVKHFPVFTSRRIHSNYIDCVQFFGKFLLSKSCDNEIIFSKPDLLDTEKGFPENQISEEITYFGDFVLKETSYWFIKFSMDFEQTLLSVGNNSGVTFVWDMSDYDLFEYEPLILERKKCQSIIRQTSFSKDGKILVCVSDDSSIWRWNITRVNTSEDNTVKVSNTLIAKPMGQVLVNINKEIKESLTKNDPKVERCLKAMKRLNNIKFIEEKPEDLKNELKSIVSTLDKCRKYVFNEDLKQMADSLFNRFTNLIS